MDEDQNPTFETQVTVENIPAGIGSGYSKKESQQEAAHETLNKIKSDAQFIDLIFIAKNEREKTQGGEVKVENATENQPTDDQVEACPTPEAPETPQTENSSETVEEAAKA